MRTKTTPKITMNPARDRSADPARRSRKGAAAQAALPLGDAPAAPADPLEAVLAKVRGELIAARAEQQRTAAELGKALQAEESALGDRDEAQGRADDLAQQLEDMTGQRDKAREERQEAEDALAQAKAQERIADEEKGTIEKEATTLAGDLAGQRFADWTEAAEWLRAEHDRILRRDLTALRGAPAGEEAANQRSALARAERRIAELLETQHRDRDEMAAWRTRAELAEAKIVAPPRVARPKVSPTSEANPALAEKRRAAAVAAVATRRKREAERAAAAAGAAA